MFYREDGFVAKVEVIATEKEGAGHKTSLKIIKVIETGIYKPEALPKEGEIFSVWAADGFEHYAGWSLSQW